MSTLERVKSISKEFESEGQVEHEDVQWMIHIILCQQNAIDYAFERLKQHSDNIAAHKVQELLK